MKEKPAMKRPSLLSVASIFQLGLLLLLTRWVRLHPVSQFDTTISRRMQHFHPTIFSLLSRFLGVLCSWKLAIVLTFPLTWLLWNTRQRAEAVTMTGSIVLGTALRTGMQHLIARPRPSPALVHVTKEKKSPSFPSGHAATALSWWGWLLLITTQMLKDRPMWRRTAQVILATVICLAGPSRVYLGEHWTTDVLGGYVYGGACLTLSCSLCSLFKQRANNVASLYE